MIECGLLIAVEDELSEAVLRKLIEAAGRGFSVSRVINARGNGQLKAGMAKFRNACHVLPHVVLTDLDRYPCPPALLEDWKAMELPCRLLVRIAVREVEAWLLADREGMADFLSTPKTKLSADPEGDPDPKRTLLNLARKSRKRRLASELVPEPGSSASIGPLYNRRMSDFVATAWSPERAIPIAPSLNRSVTSLRSFLVSR
jgi:hypothetical protein